MKSTEPFVVAELSGNHGGSLERAIGLVRAARDAGADAIKTQCFDPESLTIDHDGPGFIVDHGIWRGRKLIDLYRETGLPVEWHAKLFAEARRLSMEAFASVFDAKSADHIAALKPWALKLATLEIVDIPLIRYVAAKRLPVVLSCGMASNTEINEARIASVEAPERTLLHCPPGYPSDPGTADLGRMAGIGKLFGLPTGLSDHTLSVTLPAVAVGMGATIIEKHLCLSRADGGPDAAFSLMPHEFKQMVVNCREAAAAIRAPARAEEPHRHLRRSLYVVADIAEGETLTADNIRSIRPGYGLHPREWDRVIGKPAVRDLKRGSPLALVDIDWGHAGHVIREGAGLAQVFHR